MARIQPTIIRKNARFRGPTGLSDYSNYLLETIHDMKLLGGTMDRNENIPGHRGQSDHIKDNLKAYLHGDAAITASVDSATVLFHVTEPVQKNMDIMSTDWADYGSVERSSLQVPGALLSSPGLLDPAGVSTQLIGEEGDIFYLRMKVVHKSGNTLGFSIGSHNINYGEGDMERKTISQNSTTNYVDKRLYCKHRGPFTVNIDVHNLPDFLEPGAVEISELSIHYAEEHHLSVSPVDTEIKSRVNQLESKLKNIINT